MVALGTHPVLSEEKILGLYGITSKDRAGAFRQCEFFCRRWDLPDTFLRIGELSREDTGKISSGLVQETAPIDINKKICDYDLVLIRVPVLH